RLEMKLTDSNGFTTILTIVDRFSKACHLVPLKSLPSSADTAQLLVKHVLHLHGIPEEILSDRGPQFVSRVWKEFAEALGAKVALNSGHHPQTNGQCERMNQELGAMLHCVCSSHPSSWSTHLPWVEYAHNSHISSATGQSPFESSLGFSTSLFPQQTSVSSVPQFLRGASRAWASTRAALDRTALRKKQLADRRRRPAPVYTPGQRVWLSSKDIPLKASSRKLSPHFIGPFKVWDVPSPTMNVYVLNTLKLNVILFKCLCVTVQVTVKMYKRGSHSWLGKSLNATATIPSNTIVMFRINGEEFDAKIPANTIHSITLSI
ncbi:transcript variant X2, partial [Nothobranchius furzeri]